jgi:hypothetical protein
MPIRLNLLAEAQAAEELRRKDPVTRTMWIAGLLAGLMLLWCAVLYARLLAGQRTLASLRQQWNTLERANFQTVANRKKTIEIEDKLNALQRLSANRFLWGTALNAFQQTLEGIDGVQIVKLKTDQTYIVTEEPKPRGATNAPAPAASRASVTNKPAAATEKITMIVEGMDSSTPLGSQVIRFKEKIAGMPFFVETLQKTNGVFLTAPLSAPQVSPLGGNRFVTFSLECAFTEKVRHK